MSNYWDKRERFENVGTLTVSGSTALVKPFGRIVDVKRLILLTTTAQTVADDTVTVAVRKLDNTSSTTAGTFVATFTGSALNQVRFVDFGLPSDDPEADTVQDQLIRSASVVYSAPQPRLLRLYPDEELVITPAAGATAGAYDVWVQFQDLGFNPKDNPDYTPVELTFTAA